MFLTYQEAIEEISKRTTKESRTLLYTIKDHSLNKMQMWESANLEYLKMQQKRGVEEPRKLIASRYSLDLNMARLEGGGLADVKSVGVVRIYTITKMGQDLLAYSLQKNN